MFDVHNFTAISSKTTPKILRITLIPDFPIMCSILRDSFKTE